MAPRNLSRRLSKKQKSRSVEHDEDFISRLPFMVLAQILSLLPVDEAARTCILSKNWRYIWALTPHLRFSMPKCKNVDEVARYFDFVDQVMSLRDGMEIKDFCFRGVRKYDKSRLYHLIDKIITHDVQVFHLDLRGSGREFLFSPVLFRNYGTLVELRLGGHIHLMLPPNACFPSLKTLELRSVAYFHEYTIMQLILGCPVLVELLIEKCLKEMKGDFSFCRISSSSLRRLTLFFGLYSHCCKPNQCNFYLSLNCPNLKQLSLSDHISVGYSIHNYIFPSLEEGYVDVEPACLSGYLMNRDEYARRVLELIRSFSTVRSLSLSGHTLEGLGYIRHAFYPPLFPHLVELTVGVDETNGWLWLSTLLSNMPNLEVLSFPDGLTPGPDFFAGYFRFNWRPSEQVPACLRFKLKVISITNLYGETKKEANLIKYLLENGKVLTSFTIRFNSHAVTNLTNELLEFPKGSSSCELKIS